MNLEYSELRKLAWRGIPASYRPICWRLMTGLLPTARERRSTTLTKKRNEYWKLVDRYFKLRVEDNHKVGFYKQKVVMTVLFEKSGQSLTGLYPWNASKIPPQETYHQIKIDIPRTNPSIELYQQPKIQVKFIRPFIRAISDGTPPGFLGPQ